MRHSTRFVMMGLLALAIAVPAAAQDAVDPAGGAELARTWCSDCHVVSPQQEHGNDAVPSFAAISADPTTTPASLQAFLAKPHGQMPDLKLSHRQIDDVVAYILGLRQR
jgi:mono/diheme cytochrome c family protein